MRIQHCKAVMGQKPAVSFCAGTVSIYFGLKKGTLQLINLNKNMWHLAILCEIPQGLSREKLPWSSNSRFEFSREIHGR